MTPRTGALVAVMILFLLYLIRKKKHVIKSSLPSSFACPLPPNVTATPFQYTQSGQTINVTRLTTSTTVKKLRKTGFVFPAYLCNGVYGPLYLMSKGTVSFVGANQTESLNISEVIHISSKPSTSVFSPHNPDWFFNLVLVGGLKMWETKLGRDTFSFDEAFGDAFKYRLEIVSVNGTLPPDSSQVTITAVSVGNTCQPDGSAVMLPDSENNGEIGSHKIGMDMFVKNGLNPLSPTLLKQMKQYGNTVSLVRHLDANNNILSDSRDTRPTSHFSPHNPEWYFKSIPGAARGTYHYVFVSVNGSVPDENESLTVVYPHGMWQDL